MQPQDLDRIVLEIISKFGVPDVEAGRYIAYAAAGLILLRLAMKGAKLAGAASWRGMKAGWIWLNYVEPVPPPPGPSELAAEILAALDGAEVGKWDNRVFSGTGKPRRVLTVGPVSVEFLPNEHNVAVGTVALTHDMLSELDWKRVVKAAEFLRQRTEMHAKRQEEKKLLETLRVCRGLQDEERPSDSPTTTGSAARWQFDGQKVG